MITISGTLTNPSGAPLPFVSIFVNAVQSVPGADAIPETSLATYQASSTGEYSFSLEDGVYTISISGSGLAQSVSLGQAVVNSSSIDTDLITLVGTSGVPTSTIMAAIVTASQDAAATVTVGTTTTGNPGTDASVTNSGTSSAAVLDFTVPAGPEGPQGKTGLTGPTGATGAAGRTGAAATVSVGTTTTGASGTEATVTNSGTDSAAVLDFTVPAGESGAIAVQYSQTASASATLDQADGTVQALTLTEDCTLTLSPTTSSSGNAEGMIIILTQGASTASAVTWPSGTVFGAGAPPTLSTTSGESDIFVALLLDGSSNWLVLTAQLGVVL